MPVKYHASRELAHASIVVYENCLERAILPHLGKLPLDIIDDDVVLAFIDTLRRVGLSNRNISATLDVLSAVLGKARKWMYIDHNPVNSIDAIFLGRKPEGIDR